MKVAKIKYSLRNSRHLCTFDVLLLHPSLAPFLDLELTAMSSSAKVVRSSLSFVRRSRGASTWPCLSELSKDDAERASCAASKLRGGGARQLVNLRIARAEQRHITLNFVAAKVFEISFSPTDRRAEKCQDLNFLAVRSFVRSFH